MSSSGICCAVICGIKNGMELEEARETNKGIKLLAPATRLGFGVTK